MPIALIALAVVAPASAAEKTVDLAAYCRKHHGPTAFPSVDRRDDGLMCSQRTDGGLRLVHRKIDAAAVCAAQHRTRRFRRQGKDLICISGSDSGPKIARTIDLTKHCRAKHGPTAFVTWRRTDGRPMCTIRTHRDRGLRHHLIDLVSLCGGGSPRVDGTVLHCAGTTAGSGSPPPRSGGVPPGTWIRSAKGSGPGAPASVPHPRRKGGGAIKRSDLRGCGHGDRELQKHRFRARGGGLYSGWDFGGIPTPCPGLEGGLAVDLRWYCRASWMPDAAERQGRKGARIVWIGSKRPACYFPNLAKTSPGMDAEMRRGSFQIMLTHACTMAVPALRTTRGSAPPPISHFVVAVVKFSDRRLECFYFRALRLSAIQKSGTSAGRKPKKPKTSDTITEEY